MDAQEYRDAKRWLGRSKDEKNVFALLPGKYIAHLSQTCFRKPGYLAGNFLHWRTPEQFLWRAERFLSKVAFDELAEGGKGQFSFELQFEEPVGWSSTIESSELPQEGLKVERRPLNTKATGLFLLPENRVLAKLTSKVTCVGALRKSRRSVYFVLYTVYPGRDIGDLYGDMSEREKVFFLDWYSRGETPPHSLPHGLYMTE